MQSLSSDASRTVAVDPRLLHAASGVTVEPGQRYTFKAVGKWKDWFVVCDHHGWGRGWPTRLNRVKGQPFFRLCASIGKTDLTAFAVNTTQPWVVPDITTPDGDHQLYLFANDYRWMYWNNRALTEEQGGPLRVTITRIG